MTDATDPALRRKRFILVVAAAIAGLAIAIHFSLGKKEPQPGLTMAEFRGRVASGVSLVDFWADWCGPCRVQAPIIAKLAGRFEGKVMVVKVDVDANRGIAEELGIEAIPTIIIFKDGKEAGRFIVLNGEATLAAALAALLS